MTVNESRPLHQHCEQRDSACSACAGQHHNSATYYTILSAGNRATFWANSTRFVGMRGRCQIRLEAMISQDSARYGGATHDSLSVVPKTLREKERPMYMISSICHSIRVSRLIYHTTIAPTTDTNFRHSHVLSTDILRQLSRPTSSMAMCGSHTENKSHAAFCSYPHGQRCIVQSSRISLVPGRCAAEPNDYPVCGRTYIFILFGMDKTNLGCAAERRPRIFILCGNVKLGANKSRIAYDKSVMSARYQQFDRLGHLDAVWDHLPAVFWTFLSLLSADPGPLSGRF